MADLAKLVVKLEAESAKLHKDLERANKKLGRFEKRAGKAGKALKNFAKAGGVAMAAATASVIAMGNKFLDTADRIAKMSQSSGVAVETLSRLQHAANLSGVSFEVMSKGITKLQRSMYDANQGLKTQSDAFGSLGVSVVDSTGKLRDTEAVMQDVAEKFKAMEDGAEKAATAQILFGRSGVEMIPFLNAGKEGLQEMATEADKLGLTLGSKTAKAAERVNDQMTRVSGVLRGVFMKVMEALLPHIENAVNALKEWATDPANVKGAIETMSNIFKTFATVVLILKAAFLSAGTALGAFAAALVMAASFEFTKAADILTQGAEDTKKVWADTMADIRKMWDKPGKLAPPEANEKEAIDGAKLARTAMQTWMDKNPLSVKVNPEYVPNTAVAGAGGGSSQPVNITVPGGEPIPLHGNPSDINKAITDMQRQAMKTGHR